MVVQRRQSERDPAKYSHLSSSTGSERRDRHSNEWTARRVDGRVLDEICEATETVEGERVIGSVIQHLDTQFMNRLCELLCRIAVASASAAAAATITISFPTFLVCLFEVTRRRSPVRPRLSLCPTNDRRFFEIGLPSVRACVFLPSLGPKMPP